MKRLFFFLLALFAARSAVIGIDFGAEFFKISLISPGKSFVIIENPTSKRKTPTAISFLNGERIYDQDAVNKRSKNPQNTFVFMKKYLGKPANDIKLLQTAKKFYEDYLFDTDTERNTFKFELKDFKLHDDWIDEHVFLTIEEIMAMILKYGKSLSEQQGNIEIKDCVITVPSNWDSEQKKALLDAAHMAGLHALGFISDNTAAALYYGIDRVDENITHTVIFYNLGSSSLQVSLVEYGAVNSTDKTYKKPIETIKVLADVTDNEVSGIAFDTILAEHFADVFDNLPSRKHKTSIRSSSGAMIRLTKECNKLKEVLSANKESPFYVENLYDGEDFKSHIERSAFEEKSSHLFSKLIEPIEKVLALSNRTLANVDRLEIIGGAVRIPKVQQKLNEFLGKTELGAHLNGDEAMAFGAAFHAANLSHSFKVRPIWLYDGNDFEIELTIKNLDENEEEKYEKAITIFPKRQRFGSKKVISFSYNKNIKIELRAKYDNSEKNEGKLLASYVFSNISQIEKIEKYSSLGKPKIHMQFIVSSTWPTVDLEMAEATLEETKLIEYEETNRKKPKDNNSTSNNETNSNSTEEENSENLNSSTAKKQKKKIITHYITLNVERKIEGFKNIDQSQFEASRKKLIEFDKHEEFLRKNSESKNKLESYIYKVRDLLLEEEFLRHTSPIEKDQLETISAENDEWLYSDEAFSSNFTEFNKRYHKLYHIASDITHRLDEHKKRPAALENAAKKLAELEKKINDINKTMAWVNETHKAPAIAEIAKTRSWIKNKTNLQAEKPLYEDPVFTVGQLEYLLKDVKEAYINLKNIKKPKEPKKKKEEKKKDENVTLTDENTDKTSNTENSEKPTNHAHDQDLEEKNPEKEQVSEREDL